MFSGYIILFYFLLCTHVLVFFFLSIFSKLAILKADYVMDKTVINAGKQQQ